MLSGELFMTGNELEKFDEGVIRDRIYSIRGYQVMLDRDLAELYGVETRILNQAVKRNKERFPDDFCFQLDESEYENIKSCIKSENRHKNSLRSQIVIIEDAKGRHTKYLPFVYTEQGVAMLSAVLRSETAIIISVKIMKAFVEMRKFIQSNAQVFQRLDRVEVKLIENDIKLDKLFNALESKELQPKQGIFFDGQIFDAYKFVSDLFRRAEKSVLIIDNYIDDTVLVLLVKVNKNVKVTILTQSVSPQLKLDIEKFSEQYFPIEIRIFKKSHDRFIIIDDSDVYHFGASLKDLGKKWFGFSKFGIEAVELLSKLNEYK